MAKYTIGYIRHCTNTLGAKTAGGQYLTGICKVMQADGQSSLESVAELLRRFGTEALVYIKIADPEA